MAKMQEENMLLKEENISEKQKQENIKKLKSFSGFRKTVITATGKDECINNAKCEGNCSHIEEAQLIAAMAKLGGRRNSPMEEPVVKTCHKCSKCNEIFRTDRELKNHTQNNHKEYPTCPFCEVSFHHTGALRQHISSIHNEANEEVLDKFTCPQCDTKFRLKGDMERHVNETHRDYPNCPFCQVSFLHIEALRQHIKTTHNESNDESVQIVDNIQRHKRPERPCHFFFQPRGCKKGNSCDYSHESGAENLFTKVPKVCNNGLDCTWKPRCRYVHLEDGEKIPNNVNREQGFIFPNIAKPPPRNSHYSLKNNEEFPCLRKHVQ